MQKNVNGDANKKEVYMKITWLGQAGLLFDNGKVKIMVDPYLSNSVEKVEPKNFRRVPVDEELFNIEPDFMIFTHDHLDHYDPETASLTTALSLSDIVSSGFTVSAVGSSPGSS